LTEKDYHLNNLFIAVSAGALWWAYHSFATDGTSLLFVLAVSLLTFAVYSFLRKSLSVKTTVLLAVAGAGVFAFEYDEISNWYFLIASSLLLCAYPFFRKITGVKNVVIALVWTLVCCFPIGEKNGGLTISLFSITAWIFSLSILCDLLDEKNDQDYLKTLPIVLGRIPAFILSLLLAIGADIFQAAFSIWHTVVWILVLNCFLIKNKTLIYHAIEASSVILVILQFLSFFYDKS